MEISHGLFFTVAASLFASFLLAKFVSFVSACEAEYKIYAANRKAAARESRLRRGSGARAARVGRVGLFDDEKRLRFIEESVIVDECDEEEEDTVFEFRVLDEEDVERKSVGAATVTSTSSDSSDCDVDKVFDEIPERLKSNEVSNSGVDLGDEWEWEMEGFEQSELEKYFRAALEFVKSENNVNRVSVLEDDVKVELNWLHKVATEGPNSEQQSTALKIFARAKWNAWRQVENMSQEVAMEHYIALLSKCIPNWMKNDTADFETTQTSDKIDVADPNLISKEKE